MEITEQASSMSKLSKIMVFQLLQKNFAAIGISRNLVDQKYPLNWKILLGFFALTLFFISNLMYTIREAKTFTEYNQSMYMSAITVTNICGLLIVVLSAAKFFNLIDGFGNLSNTSK